MTAPLFFRDNLKRAGWAKVQQGAPPREGSAGLNDVCRSHWLRSYGTDFGKHPGFEEYREHWVAAMLEYSRSDNGYLIEELEAFKKHENIKTPDRPNMRPGKTYWEY